MLAYKNFSWSSSPGPQPSTSQSRQSNELFSFSSDLMQRFFFFHLPLSFCIFAMADCIRFIWLMWLNPESLVTFSLPVLLRKGSDRVACCIHGSQPRSTHRCSFVLLQISSLEFYVVQSLTQARWGFPLFLNPHGGAIA